MDGAKASANPDEAEREVDGRQEPKMGPGLSTLLTGSKTADKAGPQVEAPGPRPERRARLTLLRGSLLAADVMLVGLAAFLTLGMPGALTPMRIGLCIVVLGLGAWLGCMAFWWKPEEEPNQGSTVSRPGEKEPDQKG